MKYQLIFSRVLEVFGEPLGESDTERQVHIFAHISTGKKWETRLYVKIMRNWWNFNGIKKNSIPLSGILMV